MVARRFELTPQFIKNRLSIKGYIIPEGDLRKIEEITRA